MAKHWQKAVVTYNGGLSYEFRGNRFHQGRPVQVTTEAVARALEGKNGFSVQHEFTESAEEDVGSVASPSPVAKPVKKTKRADGE